MVHLNPTGDKSNAPLPSQEQSVGKLEGHKVTFGTKLSSLIQTIIGIVRDLFTTCFGSQSTSPSKALSEHTIKKEVTAELPKAAVPVEKKFVEKDGEVIEARLRSGDFENTEGALFGISGFLLNKHSFTEESLGGEGTTGPAITELKCNLRVLQKNNEPLIPLTKFTKKDQKPTCQNLLNALREHKKGLEKDKADLFEKKMVYLEQLIKYFAEESVRPLDVSSNSTKVPSPIVAQVFGPLFFPVGYEGAVNDFQRIIDTFHLAK